MTHHWIKSSSMSSDTWKSHMTHTNTLWVPCCVITIPHWLTEKWVSWVSFKKIHFWLNEAVMFLFSGYLFSYYQAWIHSNMTGSWHKPDVVFGRILEANWGGREACSPQTSYDLQRAQHSYNIIVAPWSCHPLDFSIPRGSWNRSPTDTKDSLYT